MKTDEEIKKEFRKFCDDNGFNPLRDEVSDWWLSKLHTLQEEYKKELIEKIEKMPKYWQTISTEDIINIIKQ